jgi:alanine-synthesizing transaminase
LHAGAGTCQSGLLYSRRLPWFVSQNRIAEEITGLRSFGRALLDLTNSNPTKAEFDYPHASIAAALGRLSDYSYDPQAQGAVQAREAIVSHYAARGIRVSAEQIFLTASTSEAYGYLFKLLCDPGDEILIPLPSYPLFEYLASLENVRTRPYQLRYDGAWHVDFAALEAQVSAHTRAIVVVNPNNPTGSFLKQDEIDRLMAIASRHELAVISDEVFLDYALDAPANAVKSLVGYATTLTFSLDGVSKSAGMPQMKLGWIVATGPDEQVAAASARLEIILDTYLSVNTPVERALPDLLKAGTSLQTQIQQRTRENLRTLKHGLRGTAANALTTEGGWSAIVRLPRICSEEEWVLKLLREEGVIAQPGYFFDMPSEAFAVLSLITPPPIFEEGVRRLVQLLGRDEQGSCKC